MPPIKRKLFTSPLLETVLIAFAVVISYAGLWILSATAQDPLPGQMPTQTIALLITAFFLISIAISLVSVVAGIGGGVIFTPLMLAFTGVNSLVVRGTGILVVLLSGLSSTGIFLKNGMTNYRLALLMTLAQGLGALGGAMGAVYAADAFGPSGDGVMRLVLGLILLAVAIYFILSSQKTNESGDRPVDRFTAWLQLDGSYFEQSEGVRKTYRVRRAGLGMLLVFVVGLIGGFFGMGGGWAVTPVLNMGMAVPLKAAAANTGMILGVGSCISVWPYLFAGGVIPMFALPWLSGQVIGGFIGSYVLAKIRVKMVRFIMIGIMVYTSFGLVSKGLSNLGLIASIPPAAEVAVLTLVFALVVLCILREKKQARKEQKS